MSVNAVSKIHVGSTDYDTFDSRIVISAAVDLNDLVPTSQDMPILRYIQPADNISYTITNIPISGYVKTFILESELIKSNSSATSRYIRQTWNSPESSYQQCSYVRYYKGGSWGSWIKWDYTNTQGTDTKNTTGATEKTSTKMYLIGATGQGTNPVTYSNSNVYIDSNNRLDANGFVANGDINAGTVNSYNIGGTTNHFDTTHTRNIDLYRYSTGNGGTIQFKSNTSGSWVSTSDIHADKDGNIHVATATDSGFYVDAGTISKVFSVDKVGDVDIKQGLDIGENLNITGDLVVHGADINIGKNGKVTGHNLTSSSSHLQLAYSTTTLLELNDDEFQFKFNDTEILQGSATDDVTSLKNPSNGTQYIRLEHDSTDSYDYIDIGNQADDALTSMNTLGVKKVLFTDSNSGKIDALVRYKDRNGTMSEKAASEYVKEVVNASIDKTNNKITIGDNNVTFSLSGTTLNITFN